eukprot:TRINITY_DN9575_c0_g3_i1.p2 TRINITY_DN9575_c0_g3~~TRINITY_DN9575_c0_g3_i1.p2  ORF type:complete len:140 (+),score=8.05 TRINITY_DN9575_c0_g3_i1:74-493(+)
MPTVPSLELGGVVRRKPGVLTVRLSTARGASGGTGVVQERKKGGQSVFRIKVSKEEIDAYREKVATQSQMSVAGSEDSLCVACFERPVTSQLIPCAHSPLCSVCLPRGLRTASKEPLCPICRQPVTHMKKVVKRGSTPN